MTQRKMIKERKRYYGELEGRLVDVIASLQAEIDQHGASVYFDKGHEYDYGDYCYDIWFLVYEREETDAEMQKRVKAATKARATRASKSREPV